MDLVVIGNGFDIAHGLKTRYSDFMKYLLKLEEMPKMIIASGYYETDSISEKDKIKLNIYNKLEKYILEQDLWNNLEEALGKLDHEQLEEENSMYYLGYGEENWRDSANHDYQYMIEDDLDFTTEMNMQFINWIKIIDTEVKPIFKISEIMKTSNIYLNFNYTNTLEEVYSIPENNITYIHGKAYRGDKLILGHHNNSYWTKEDVSKMSNDEYAAYWEYQLERDFREIEAEKVIMNYFKRTYKDTKAIIEIHSDFFSSLIDVENIFVFGHSLSEIDFDYFEKISNNVSSYSKWTISYYSNDDSRRASELMKRLCVTDFRLIKI